METGEAVIRLLCEFTVTKGFHTGFHPATTGIWHTNDCGLAATVVETYQSYVISMSGAILLIVFKCERERKELHTSPTFAGMA